MPTPTISLRMKHYEFSFPRRYYAGQTISDGEAQALNQVLTESVRSNTESWVRRAIADGGGIIEPQVLTGLQARVETYARQYQFKTRTRARTPSPVDLALDELAHTQSRTEARQHNLDPDGPEAKLRYRQLLSDSDLHIRARQIVAERGQIASQALEELLG